MQLRDYQSKAIEDLRRAFAAGSRKILLQAATGAGKTVIAAEIVRAAAEKGSPVLFFAHRRELVYQASDKLKQFGVDHGLIMSEEFFNDFVGVHVCSVDTFRARAMSGRMEMPPAKVVVIDEAHRSLAPTYLKIIEHYSQEGAAVLGLTATPCRGDGTGLGNVYDDMVCCPSIRELTELKHLVPARYFAPAIPDLTGVETKRGDYDEKQLQDAMDQSHLVGDIVTNWLRIAEGRKTVVFASGVRHSIHIRDRFKEAGVRCEHIDGTTSVEERNGIVAKLRSGAIDVISNCMVFTEGFDEPSLSCCVLARPTKSYGLYLQMAGRTLRPWPGKEDTLIIDHSGAVYRHGLLIDQHGWTLEGRKMSEKEAAKKQKRNETFLITCEKCFFMYAGQVHCPKCGHRPVRKGRYVDTKDGDLQEVTSSRPSGKKGKPGREERVLWWNQFMVYGRSKGYKPGWAFHKYREKFKEWPAKDFPELPDNLVELTPEFRSYVRYLNIRAAKGAAKRAGNG